jgi:YtkA-like
MSTDCAQRRCQLIGAAFALVSIAVILAAFATGCSKHAPSPTAAWKLTLKVDPDHPRMVRPATFTVHIAASPGAAVDAARVTGSLNMTLMNMGKTEVYFEPQGHGDYAATLPSFDMSGPWELTVDASQGSITAHKVFPVTIFD